AARVPVAPRRGRRVARGSDRELRDVAHRLGAEHAARGAAPARARAAVQEARCLGRGGRTGADAGGSVIDTHAHLDACSDPADVVLERAREAGVERVIAVGTGVESCRTTLAIAERSQGVWAAL